MNIKNKQFTLSCRATETIEFLNKDLCFIKGKHRNLFHCATALMMEILNFHIN